MCNVLKRIKKQFSDFVSPDRGRRADAEDLDVPGVLHSAPHAPPSGPTPGPADHVRCVRRVQGVCV